MVVVGVLETLRRLESLRPSWDGSNRITATRERRARVESSDGAARSPESHRMVSDVANGVLSDVVSGVETGVETGVVAEEASGVASCVVQDVVATTLASVAASVESEIVAGLVDGAASGEAAVAPIFSTVTVASTAFDAPSSTVRTGSSRTR